MMFPVEDEGLGDETQNKIKINLTKELPNLQSPNSKLPFEAIEAAKALEFQWPQSEMRHALIRSIGIDSRNIVMLSYLFIFFFLNHKKSNFLTAVW